MVICSKRSADCLNMVQLMPLHPKTPSLLTCFIKIQTGLVFLVPVTQVVLEKRSLNECSSSSSRDSFFIAVQRRWRYLLNTGLVSDGTRPGDGVLTLLRMIVAASVATAVTATQRQFAVRSALEVVRRHAAGHLLHVTTASQSRAPRLYSRCTTTNHSLSSI